MTTPILISILGAISALTVALISAWYTNRNSIILQLRKSKEEYYFAYIEAVHNLASNNNNDTFVKKYVFARDKLFIIAGEIVIKKIFLYENEAVGKTNQLHDKYLTDVIKEIRKDLSIKDTDFPMICLKKS
jgi:hypothetical protein